ncbi:hypothetical protein BHM03_00046389 [Ensete ventricosum]|nr:hypothetical protein BHM03_00046389 [Ensete ventricosum]
MERIRPYEAEVCNKFSTLLVLERLIFHGVKDEGSFEVHASYLKDAFDRVTKVIKHAEAKLGSGYLSTGQEDAEAGTLEEYAIVLSFELSGTRGMIGAAGELDCFSAHIRLRKPGKSEDKVECKSTDSRAMSLAAPWYRRGGTSVESSIPCSHGGRALVVKGAEEVENATAKLQVPRQDRRTEAKKFHKTDVDELLIKIVENERLRIDTGVLDQGTK